MFDIKRFVGKFRELIPTDDVVSILEKLPDDPTLNQISESAGTVAGIIKIALHITEKVYEAKVPVEKRLSLTLMRIMLESARDSLPYSILNVKIEEVLDDQPNLGFESIVLELFDPKYNEAVDEQRIITYLPDHPVFNKFRNLLKNGIDKFNHHHEFNVNIPKFLMEFNLNLITKLEEEGGNNQDLRNLLLKWQVNSNFRHLVEYSKNAGDYFFDLNSIDGKSLSEYYVENKAYVVDKKTWDQDEKEIEKKSEWTLESFLRSSDPIAVVAAPFGIGKSSLAKKLAYESATKFIENPTDPYSRVPIFVPLESSLEATCNHNSLENDLERISLYSSRKKDQNILVILDGLDELPDDRPISIYNIYSTVLSLIKAYPNGKVIITTRLEAGFPGRLNIKDSYVRLFSFNKDQIKQFFKIYGLQSNYENLSNMLTEQKLGKPLFCWMIATVYNKSTDQDREVLFDYSKKYNLGEIFPLPTIRS